MLHSSLRTLSFVVVTGSSGASGHCSLSLSTPGPNEQFDIRFGQLCRHVVVDERTMAAARAKCGTQSRDDLGPGFIGVCGISVQWLAVCSCRTLLREASTRRIHLRELRGQRPQLVQQHHGRYRIS